MAAEERRKQKEQIKILKQQVGLLFILSVLTNLFSPYLSVLTHVVPVFAAENAERLFCDALKLFNYHPLLLLLKLLLSFFPAQLE